MANKETGFKSFIKLLEESKIEIPNYQREYSYGRDTNYIRDIMEKFIDDLCDSLENNNEFEINPAYGDSIKNGHQEGNQSTVFLIDGQQRLTTLFLLHWYIYKRNEYRSGIKKLEKFRYTTRTTTRVFCELLCGKDLKIQFNKGKSISCQIRDNFKYTLAMDSDPTVRAMLVVLDYIHKKLEKKEVSEYKERLKNIKVSVSSLELFRNREDDKDALEGLKYQEEDAVLDLYIKMNDRGKRLTGFEIIKAGLERQYVKRFDVIAQYLVKNRIEEEKRIELFTKINTSYTDFFFVKVFKDDESEDVAISIDEAMEAMLVEIVAWDFLCYWKKKHSIKEMVNHDILRGMKGQAFLDFVIHKKSDNQKFLERILKKEPESINYEEIEEIRETFVDSISTYFGVLDFLSEDENEDIWYKKNYKRDFLIEKIKDLNDNTKSPTLADAIIRMAIWKFVYRFKNNITEEAYETWINVVAKVVDASNMPPDALIRTIDAWLELMNHFNDILDIIESMQRVKLDKNCILAGIKNYVNDNIYEVKDVFKQQKNGKIVMDVSNHQLALIEEAIKASLIETDPEIEETVRKLEETFSQNNSYYLNWMVIDLASTSKESKIGWTDEHNPPDKEIELFPKVEKEKLDKAIDLMNLLFKDGKSAFFPLLDQAILSQLGLEETHFLRMNDSAKEEKQIPDESTIINKIIGYKGMPTDEYKAVKALFKECLERSPKDEGELEKFFQDKIKGAKDTPEDITPEWKRIFIEHENEKLFHQKECGFSVMTKKKTRDVFTPQAIGTIKDKDSKDTYTVLFGTPKKRGESAEIKSYLLALRLKDAFKDLQDIDEKLKYQVLKSEEVFRDDHGKKFPLRFISSRTNDGGEIKIWYEKRESGESCFCYQQTGQDRTVIEFKEFKTKDEIVNKMEKCFKGAETHK